jgi:hypothetical protein
MFCERSTLFWSIVVNYELKVEFWDVHFSQGSYKQSQRNEKNKAKKYSDAFRARK